MVINVADTTMGRVWRWSVSRPGNVEHDNTTGRGRHLFAAPAGAPIFDSLAVEAEGSLCVGTPFRGRITVLHPDGAAE